MALAHNSYFSGFSPPSSTSLHTWQIHRNAAIYSYSKYLSLFRTFYMTSPALRLSLLK